MEAAQTPSDFFTISYLTRIANTSAITVGKAFGKEMVGAEGLKGVMILRNGFAGVNRDALAEQLAALDIRDFGQQPPEFANQYPGQRSGGSSSLCQSRFSC